MDRQTHLRRLETMSSPLSSSPSLLFLSPPPLPLSSSSLLFLSPPPLSCYSLSSVTDTQFSIIHQGQYAVGADTDTMALCVCVCVCVDTCLPVYVCLGV